MCDTPDRLWQKGIPLIDDAQFMFMGRRTDQVLNFKSFIKLASDRNAFNVLLVGEKVVRDVVDAVDYLMGRGNFPHARLSPLGDTATEFEHFTLMLEGIDNRLLFTLKSGLSEAKIAADTHRFSGGLIGRVMNLIQAAGFEAINDGTSKIMIEHLRSAAGMQVAVAHILISGNRAFADITWTCVTTPRPNNRPG